MMTTEEPLLKLLTKELESIWIQLKEASVYQKDFLHQREKEIFSVLKELQLTQLREETKREEIRVKEEEVTKREEIRIKEEEITKREETRTKEQEATKREETRIKEEELTKRKTEEQITARSKMMDF
ncbi:hypothetical protein K7432_002799 [Basidiobolus ranarum]|uniref:Uncharacterized protein n=1 Tax=Basidiobolus ranarum TaxID=34480 RepID=A0ABR2W837_9FUNG